MKQGLLQQVRRLRPVPRTHGFTLIELMITVAIVAILAAVALPSYRNYVIRGQLTDATNLLSSTRARLEQFYQDNRNYGSTAAACGVAMPTSKNFTFSCNWGGGGSNQSFLMTAAGTGSTAGFSFTVDHQGSQRTTALPSGWGTAPAACWITRRGDTC